MFWSRLRWASLYHHPQRITDQQYVHATAIHQRSEAGVVACKHGDLLAAFAHGLQLARDGVEDGSGRRARVLRVQRQHDEAPGTRFLEPIDGGGERWFTVAHTELDAEVSRGVFSEMVADAIGEPAGIQH